MDRDIWKKRQMEQMWRGSYPMLDNTNKVLNKKKSKIFIIILSKDTKYNMDGGEEMERDKRNVDRSGSNVGQCKWDVKEEK